jgi:hypothetical protein
VQAFGLNRSEFFTHQGHSPNVPFPRVLGIEAVGEVVAAPDGGFEEGDTVATAMGGMGRQYDGGYAEYTLAPSGRWKDRRHDIKETTSVRGRPRTAPSAAAPFEPEDAVGCTAYCDRFRLEGVVHRAAHQCPFEGLIGALASSSPVSQQTPRKLREEGDKNAGADTDAEKM